MNNPIFKAVALLAFLMLGFFVGTKAFGDNHPKPYSMVEFKISKHAGLHEVSGGFDTYNVKYKKRDSKGIHHVKAKVNINSLWTHQADADKSDDPKRTKDLLSKDWFNVKKFPYAHAHIQYIPNEGTGVIKLTIKGITKRIDFRSSHGKLKFRIKLSDFKIDASWKRIFVGNYADVVIRIKR